MNLCRKRRWGKRREKENRKQQKRFSEQLFLFIDVFFFNLICFLRVLIMCLFPHIFWIHTLVQASKRTCTYMHARTHAHTHIHTRAHTHTHTHKHDNRLNNLLECYDSIAVRQVLEDVFWSGCCKSLAVLGQFLPGTVGFKREMH